ncbi:MAG: polysaccharide biosynthesis protein [Armatimonadetes bacterium]|nr:polysaccharide biosynthesis protein [Armatimonadota bacterium]
MNKPFDGKRLLITGGTGSLGKTLLRRLLGGAMGDPAKIIIYSRDEAKQHYMRMEYLHRSAATDEVIYRNFLSKLEFRIGDIRDIDSVATVLRDADIVFNAAAMKQVPTCEYYPYEAVKTNIEGAENIVLAISRHNLNVETVIGISTDKACKPVNVMGMTKAIQERIFIQGNMRCPKTRFVCVRYGNVLASRGSVIPLFHDQIKNGGPVTVTTPDMTRFLLSLDDAVDTVFAAYNDGSPGDIYVPRAPSALVLNVAKALIADRNIRLDITGIRPGEKIHEIMVSDEEAHRAVLAGAWYAIKAMLPEIVDEPVIPVLNKEYSSGDEVLDLDGTIDLLKRHRLMLEDVATEVGETLR